MIVSHRHRFIFLKTRKTAGTSIEIALSRVAGEDGIVTPLDPPEEGHRPRNHAALESPSGATQALVKGSDQPWQDLVRAAQTNPDYHRYLPYYNHMPAWLARAKLGKEVWGGYFKFCFERNPWDKMASLYGWRTREKENAPSFDDWLFSDPRVESDWLIYAIDDACAVDAVGHYENLNEDFCRFLRRVGIAPDDLGLPRAKSGAYPEGIQYSPAGAEHVGQVFSREVEAFSYSCPARLLRTSES